MILVIKIFLIIITIITIYVIIKRNLNYNIDNNVLDIFPNILYREKFQ